MPSERRVLGTQVSMLGWLVGRTVSIDTLHLDPNTHRATPPFSLGANKPSSAHPSPTRTTAQEKPHRPGIAASPPSTRGPCALRSRACKGRAGWGVDGEGEKAAQRGEVGGVGGVQGHRARRTSKQDMFCTFPGTCTHKLMRFGEGTESSAHLFHANRTGAPPSSRADALDSPNAATSEPPERACETDRESP